MALGTKAIISSGAVFKVQFSSQVRGLEETFKANAGIDSTGGKANTQLCNAKKVEGWFILIGCVYLVSAQKSSEECEHVYFVT